MVRFIDVYLYFLIKHILAIVYWDRFLLEARVPGKTGYLPAGHREKLYHIMYWVILPTTCSGDMH